MWSYDDGDGFRDTTCIPDRPPKYEDMVYYHKHGHYPKPVQEFTVVDGEHTMPDGTVLTVRGGHAYNCHGEKLFEVSKYWSLQDQYAVYLGDLEAKAERAALEAKWLAEQEAKEEEMKKKYREEEARAEAEREKYRAKYRAEEEAEREHTSSRHQTVHHTTGQWTNNPFAQLLKK